METFFVKFGLAALVALPIYIVLRFAYVKWKKPVARPAREIALCLFCLFMAGLVFLVTRPGAAYYGTGHAMQSAVQRLQTGKDINFTPFYTIKSFFTAGMGAAFAINIVANVLMFCPLGFCLPLLWRRWQRVYKVLPVAVLFPVCIEAVQLFIGRSVDIDDVILNTLGIVLGYLAWALLCKLLPKAKWETMCM